MKRTPRFSLARTLGLTLLAGTAALALTFSARAQQNPFGLALPNTAKVRDQFTPLLPEETTLKGGMLGERLDASEQRRLLRVDEDDLLDAFERRDQPHQDWQGEHVGKFLHAAAQMAAYSKDPALKTKMVRVVARLLKTQEPDGYLGTYPPEKRWTSWDVWVHKYDLLGLLAYYQFAQNDRQLAPNDRSETPDGKTGDGKLSQNALRACRRIGDLLVRTFGDGGSQRDLNLSGAHVGMAPDSVLEAVALLYRATGDARYRKFGEYVISHYDAPRGPAILASLEQYKSVRRVANAKAYEMTSNFNGILEMYRITGNKRFLDDMEIAWNDIVKNRLYLTGSGSSFEVWQDDNHLPNGARANLCETCVTVSWEQMNLELLRLTGEAKYAEQAERSIYNHLLGAQKPTGDDWAYYTPLEGHKPYDSATTCCHSSGPRGIALIPSFAYMTSQDGGLVVNLYNAGIAATRLPSGRLIVAQATNYPRDGKIALMLAPEKSGAHFPLRLRIPEWATTHALTLNGETLPAQAAPGTYEVIDRAWKKSDLITLDLPMPTRLVLGDHDNDGKAALLYGPLVLTLDAALNPLLTNLNRVALASDKPADFRLAPTTDTGRFGEIVFQVPGQVSGQPGPTPLYLTPFATAGQDGKSRFAVWIARPGHASDEESVAITEWRWRSETRTGLTTLTDITPDLKIYAGDWKDGRIGQDVFKGRRGFAWFRATLPNLPGAHRRLHFDGVSDNAVVFVNGKRLTAHQGGNEPFEVSLDAALNADAAQPNELLVMVENVEAGGGILQDVTLIASPK